MTNLPTLPVDIAVIGGGIAGLTVAYEAAKQGKSVVVFESRGQVGGLVIGGTVGGIEFDLGAESYANRSTVVGDLCAELGLDVASPQGNSWVWRPEHGGTASRIPFGSLGIPASLDDPHVQEVLSPAGLARAKQDLTMGPETGTDIENLAGFVAARMGQEVVDRLVAPIAGGIHSTDPSYLSVDSVIPGLRQATVETGSASAAVANIRGNGPKGTPVAQPIGGMFKLVTRLEAEIVRLGGQVATRTIVPADGLDANPDGAGWNITAYAAIANPNPALPPLPDGPGHVIQAEHVVIATTGTAAIELLAQQDELDLQGYELPSAVPIVHCTLVVNAPELDAAPRGSGLLVTVANPEEATSTDPVVTAKAMTHYSIKWGWVRDAAPAHHHILRVSWGREGEPYPKVTPEIALHDANILLGVAMGADQVVDSKIMHWGGSLPPFTPEHKAWVQTLRDQLAETNGLHIAGAWASGTGLAAVIADAKRLASQFAS